MTRSGDRLARIALRASSNISRVLSASQLGVTLASLGLGWVAESTVGEMFANLFGSLPFGLDLSMRLTIGATIALIIVTYLHAVFEFSEKNAREVMTPRTELVALPVEATLSEVLQVVQESGLSRYPVYDESIDNIIGVVLAKDLLKLLAPRANTDAFDLPSIMRPVHVIPGSREVEEVLADFKRLKEHMAVVLDEYGGTAGVVTMEDL